MIMSSRTRTMLLRVLTWLHLLGVSALISATTGISHLTRPSGRVTLFSFERGHLRTITDNVNTGVVLTASPRYFEAYLFECNATFPVQWAYIGEARNGMMKKNVGRFFQDFHDPNTYTYQSTLLMYTLQELQSGRYQCRGSSTKHDKLSIHFDVFVPGNTAQPLLSTAEKKLFIPETKKEHASYVPCGVSDSTAVINLHGGNQWEHCMGPSILFNKVMGGRCTCISRRRNKLTSITPVYRGSLNTLDYRIYYRNKKGPISLIHDIPLRHNDTGHRNKNVFNMIVEIPRWTNAKMEISRTDPLNPIKQDTKNGELRYVKNIFPHHGYIWNYGALPQTWENPNVIHEEFQSRGDNDPIDVCEIGEKIAPRGALIQVKILGCFLLIDTGETDWKLLAIDVTDPLADKLNDIGDIETHMPGYLKATVERFRTYKVPDGGKENPLAFNEQPKDAAFALGLIEETHRYWRELSEKQIKNEGGLALDRTTDSNSPFLMSISKAEAVVNANPPEGPAVPVDPLLNKWYYLNGNPSK